MTPSPQLVRVAPSSLDNPSGFQSAPKNIGPLPARSRDSRILVSSGHRRKGLERVEESRRVMVRAVRGQSQSRVRWGLLRFEVWGRSSHVPRAWLGESASIEAHMLVGASY